MCVSLPGSPVIVRPTRNVIEEWTTWYLIYPVYSSAQCRVFFLKHIAQDRVSRMSGQICRTSLAIRCSRQKFGIETSQKGYKPGESACGNTGVQCIRLRLADSVNCSVLYGNPIDRLICRAMTEPMQSLQRSLLKVLIIPDSGGMENVVDLIGPDSDGNRIAAPVAQAVQRES